MQNSISSSANPEIFKVNTNNGSHISENRKLIVALIFLFIVCIVLAVVALVSTKKLNIGSDMVINNSLVPTENIVRTKIPLEELKYVTATLPEGWSILEVEDGKSNDKVPGLGLKGLTGIQIFNSDMITLFSVDAVYGVSGTMACPEIFKFQDTPQAYIDDRENIMQTNFVGDSAKYKVIDLSSQTYIEINLLGHKIRRVGNVIYWNNTESSVNYDGAFVAICDESVGFPGLPDISFTDQRQRTLHLYYAEIVGNPSPADLVKLDEVLMSLKVK